jgi:SAM-dependent methyltransferase
MEAWYRQLIADRGRAAGCFHYDYEPYRSLLEALPGRVLDIGGGTGVARHFLAAATRYMVVDPSLEWLSDDWSALSEHFPCLSSPACFVRGLGEQLPCRDCSFDSALSLWSLNHVRNPEAVFGEVHRVLEPGGRFLVILEDMIPCWKDALIPAHRAIGGLGWPWLLIRKARLAMRGQQWSLQSDHIRIHERQITAWISGLFAIKTREWIGDYLAFEFVRAGKSLNSGDR